MRPPVDENRECVDRAGTGRGGEGRGSNKTPVKNLENVSGWTRSGPPLY